MSFLGSVQLLLRDLKVGDDLNIDMAERRDTVEKASARCGVRFQWFGSKKGLLTRAVLARTNAVHAGCAACSIGWAGCRHPQA